MLDSPLQGRLRLGEWLVDQALISRAELFYALNAAFHYDCRVGDALVGLGFLRRSVVELEAQRVKRLNARRQTLAPLPLSRPRRRTPRWGEPPRRPDPEETTLCLRQDRGNPSCMVAAGVIDCERHCSGVFTVRVPTRPAVEIRRRLSAKGLSRH